MHFLESLRHQALALPSLAKFAIAMAIVVCIPPFSRRIRIPAVVGLLLTGIAVGPHALDLIGPNHPIAAFFADLGKLLLMFFAGLEIDLDLFRRSRKKAMTFGFLTTGIPLALGTAVGLLFGYSTVMALVLGSLLASHTLIALPIVTRLGITRMEPIVITCGATVMSDTLSLVVFAVCASIWKTGFSASGITVQLVEIAVFIPLILLGLSRVASLAFKKVENDENAYFALMLAVLAVAAVVAQVINLPGIVGAFLAGLAVNASVRDNAAKEKLKFFGDSLFIPIFFVVTGFVIDPSALVHSLTSDSALAAAVVGALVVGKLIAAQMAGLEFGYGEYARKTMWALTLPQVAATLAATLVAFDTLDPAGRRLLDNRLFNVVFVLMLSTSILGPVLTERFAPHMRDESHGTERTRWATFWRRRIAGTG